MRVKEAANHIIGKSQTISEEFQNSGKQEEFQNKGFFKTEFQKYVIYDVKKVLSNALRKKCFYLGVVWSVITSFAVMV